MDKFSVFFSRCLFQASGHQCNSSGPLVSPVHIQHFQVQCQVGVRFSPVVDHRKATSLRRSFGYRPLEYLRILAQFGRVNGVQWNRSSIPFFYLIFFPLVNYQVKAHEMFTHKKTYQRKCFWCTRIAIAIFFSNPKDAPWFFPLRRLQVFFWW